jgi:hypothetical protein
MVASVPSRNRTGRWIAAILGLALSASAAWAGFPQTFPPVAVEPEPPIIIPEPPITPPVHQTPEPATIGLAAIGAGIAALAHRRRARNDV